MPLSGATFYENVGGVRVSADSRAALLLADKTFRVAAGTAPPTFRRLFSEGLQSRVRARRALQDPPKAPSESINKAGKTDLLLVIGYLEERNKSHR